MMSIRRAIAASIPCAMLAGTALAADANGVLRSFSRPALILHGRAVTTVYGGGATFPIPAYLGVNLSSGSQSTGAAGSVFGYFATTAGGLNADYCATGSGKGKGVFTGPFGTVTNPCANAATGGMGPIGFSAPAGTKIPALTGTDAPLTQADYGTPGVAGGYVGTGGPGPSGTVEPVELPAIVGSIALYYNEAGTGGRLHLTEAQICGIYTGTITQWSTIKAGLSGTITPVYRADGSGTSFSFSNNLATVCGTPFSGNQQFSPNADPNLPKNAVAATGNAGVFSAVQATAGAIGYVESGYIVLNKGVVNNDNYATVSLTSTSPAEDPIANLPEAANSIKYGSQTVQPDSAVVFGTGPATYAKLTGIPGKTGCVQLVVPAAYAEPTTGYPIIGVTDLLFAEKGNGTLSTGLRNLIKVVNTQTNFATGKITTVDPANRPVGTGNTGYSALGTSFNSPIVNVANGCINS